MNSIFENDDVTITVDEKKSLIESSWKKLSVSYEAPLKEVTIHAAMHGATKWLDDLTKFGSFMPSYTIWIADELMSLLEATPVKKAALILPAYFGEEQLKSIGEKLNKGKIKFQVFNNRQKGLEFLD